jgi:hypothetical protein
MGSSVLNVSLSYGVCLEWLLAANDAKRHPMGALFNRGLPRRSRRKNHLNQWV